MAFILTGHAMQKKDDPIILKEWEENIEALYDETHDSREEVKKTAKIGEAELKGKCVYETAHSSRVCWDEYETALSIEAFWKIEENKSSKNEVLIRLSNDLRKRAVNNGMKIDDTFRNLNGIGLQLDVYKRQ